MSPLDRHACLDPEFSDEEMDAAREALFEEWAELGWPRADAAKHIDDQLVMEQAAHLRTTVDADLADDLHDQRKAGM